MKLRPGGDPPLSATIADDIPRGLYRLLLFVTGLLSTAIRIIQYPHIPPGLNVDEASSAYEALCLVQTGKDRWGNAWPPYFPSWGSGQNVLLSYLEMPVVQWLGLTPFSVRLVPLVIAILTLPLVAVALRPLGRFPALLGMLLVAIVPWHFMLSRWGLESNLAPPLMLLGCVLFSQGLATGKRRYILPSLLPFALALYAYGTTVVVLPLMGVLLVCTYWRSFAKARGAWLSALLLFAFAALPFALFFLENQVLHRNIAWTDGLLFSTPMLPSSRLEQINGRGLADIIKSNAAFFASGFNDKSAYNMAPPFPLLMTGTLPFAVIGMCMAIVALLRRRGGAGAVVNVLLFWALASLPMALLFKLNVNRFNHFFLPAIGLAVWAAHRIILLLQEASSRRFARVLVVLVLLAESGVFMQDYFTDYERSGIRSAFNVGLDEAFREAGKLPVAQIRVSDAFPSPYVYAAFFAKISPQQFQQEARPVVRDGVYSVARIGRFVFERDSLRAGEAYGYLLRVGELTHTARRVTWSGEGWEVGMVEAR